MGKINPPTRCAKMPCQAFRDKDRPVLAPGAAHRNREIFFPLCSITRQQKLKKIP
jgi:hypothetical protein